MHDTASKIGQLFFKHYVDSTSRLIVEVGSKDVNGSLRQFCPHDSVYLGVDYEHGKSVDIVVQPEEPLPIRDEFADIVVSSSQLEHDTFFWFTFCEYARILKKGGYIYINAPSNGWYHRYPEDCWRFYPDSGKALARWARKNNYAISLVESFVADREADVWNDFVAIFAKEPYSGNIDYISNYVKCRNVWTKESSDPLSNNQLSEDLEIIRDLNASVEKLKTENQASGLSKEAKSAPET